MKTIIPILLLFFACSSSQAQIIAGTVPFGYQLSNLGIYTSIGCTSLNYETYFNADCDTNKDFGFGAYNECTSTGMTRIRSAISSIDSNIEIGKVVYLDLTGFPGWTIALHLPLGDTIKQDSKFLNGNGTLSTVFWGNYGAINSAGTYISLGNPHFNFSDNYIPFRKKFANNEYLYGWIKATSYTGAPLHTNLISCTKLPEYSCIYDTIACTGSYTFCDGLVLNNIQQDTVYEALFTSITGCDSLVRTKLKVLHSSISTVYDTLCKGSTYLFPDGFSAIINTTSYFHQSNFVSQNGCDSIINTMLTTHPIYAYNIHDTIACSSSFTLPDGTIVNSIVQDTIVQAYLNTQFGCDSNFTINIHVLPASLLVENIDHCRYTDYTFPDGFTLTNISSNVTHNSNFISYQGCDSIIQTNLIIKPAYHTVNSIHACQGINYTFPDGTTINNILQDTTYVSHFTIAFGCDSNITTHIIIHPQYNIVANFEWCYGINFQFPDMTQTIITADTFQVSYFTSSYGCDSNTTTMVHAHLYNSIADSVTICSGGDYIFNGSTYSNITNDTSLSIHEYDTFGCDSIIYTTYIHPYKLDDDISLSGLTLNAVASNYNYQWYNCSLNQIIAGANSQYFTPISNGAYAVIVSDSLCVDTSACITLSNVLVNDMHQVEKFEVYPDPVSDVLYINTTLSGKKYFYNSFGQLLLCTDKNEIDVSGFAKGIYYLQIANKHKKVIVN